MQQYIVPPQQLLGGLGVGGGGFLFNQNLTIESPVSIASGVMFGLNTHIGHMTYCCPGIKTLHASIGRYCSIAANVFIGVWEHPIDRISTHPFTYNWGIGPDEDMTTPFEPFEAHRRIVDTQNLIPNANLPKTTIGNDVWIGFDVVIMSGLTVGDGAVIASRAVVTHDVEPYTIVGGVPARPIRKRFSDQIIQKLLAVKWWEYDIAPLRDKPGYRDIDLFVQTLERMIEDGQATRLCPPSHILMNDNGIFRHMIANNRS